MPVSDRRPGSLSSLPGSQVRCESQRQRLRSLPVIAILCAISVLAGCSGGGNGGNTGNGGGSAAPAITSLSPTSGAIGANVTISGSNFGSSQGSSTVTFSGVSAAAASAWSATSITVAVPTGATTGNVVVTVGGQASNGVSFTVVPVVASISVSPASPSIAVDATQQFTATATDSNGNTLTGVTFTWASSATGVATISSSGLATGVTAGTTQITASADGITSPNDTLTVTSANACTTGGSESLLNGSYAFLLKGFDNSGNPAVVIGVLTFNGQGTITAGAIDMNLDSGVESNLSVTSGTYGVGNDQRGCMVVTTSAGIQNYRLSLGNISGGVASLGHMIDFDATGPFTAGILRKQSGGPFSNASANGNYAFGGSSLQNSAVCAAPCKVGIAGMIDLNGDGGVTGGSEDFNQNGTLNGNTSNTTWTASPIPIDSGGTYSAAANGRTTMTFSVGGGSSSSDTVLYFVSPGEAFFMGSDPQTTGALLAGTALLQSGTPFAANPLSGTYVGYDSGTGLAGAGRSDLYLWGPFTSGNNALNGVGYRNTGGTFSSVGFAGSTYSVSSTGRSIISGTGGHSPLLYLVSASQAFFLESNQSVDTGFFELQSGSPFSASSASGTYAFGEIDSELLDAGVDSGVATFTPATASLGVTVDQNGSGGAPTLGTIQSLTYSIDSTGFGLIPSGCSTTVTPTTCNDIFYVISPTQAVVMDPQASAPQIQTVDQ